jgi:hypothetical protein
MFKKSVNLLDGGSYDLITEQRNVRDFLLKNNLGTDPQFIDQLTAGDIIEVYAVPENTQIYQNTEFLKICSYTPEQMSTIPFPKLFWRSEETHLALMRRAAHVAHHETHCVPWGLPPHELVESLHPRKRTFEMHMGNISPCFDIKSNAPRAWASTLKVKLIFEWEENLA